MVPKVAYETYFTEVVVTSYSRAFQLKSTAGHTPISQVLRQAA